MGIWSARPDPVGAGPPAPFGARTLLRVRANGRGVVPGMAAGIVWMGSMAAVPVVLGQLSTGASPPATPPPWADGWGVLAAVGATWAAAGAARHWLACRLYEQGAFAVRQLVGRAVLDPHGGAEVTYSPGDLVSHATSDASRIGVLVDLRCRGTGAAVTFVAVATVTLATSALLGGVVLAGLVPLLLLMKPLWRPLERRAANEQETLSAATGLAADTMVGLRVPQGHHPWRIPRGGGLAGRPPGPRRRHQRGRAGGLRRLRPVPAHAAGHLRRGG